MGAVCLFLFFLHIQHKSCDKTRGLVLWQNVHSFSQVAALWVCPFLLHGTRGEIITELLLFCLAFPKVSISRLHLGAFYSPRKGLSVFFEKVHPLPPQLCKGMVQQRPQSFVNSFLRVLTRSVPGEVSAGSLDTAQRLDYGYGIDQIVTISTAYGEAALPLCNKNHSFPLPFQGDLLITHNLCPVQSRTCHAMLCLLADCSSKVQFQQLPPPCKVHHRAYRCSLV